MIDQSSISVHLILIFYHILLYNFIIIIDREVGAPVHGKYCFGGLNAKYKRTLKLAMEKLVNPELIKDDQFLSKFVQVH